MYPVKLRWNRRVIGMAVIIPNQRQPLCVRLVLQLPEILGPENLRDLQKAEMLIKRKMKSKAIPQVKEAIAAEDAVTLTRLGFAGVVLATLAPLLAVVAPASVRRTAPAMARFDQDPMYIPNLQ